jgi:oligoendopeptidase F
MISIEVRIAGKNRWKDRGNMFFLYIKTTLLKSACCIALFLLLLATALSAEQRSLVRDSIPENYKWDLSSIYPDWETWESDFAAMEAGIENIKELKGTLSESGNNLLKAFQLQDKMSQQLRRLRQYAGLMYSQDTRNNEIGAQSQRARTLRSKYLTAFAWFEPELLEIPFETIEQWLNDTPGLEIYRYELESKFRRQEHFLGENEEKILSYFTPLIGAPNSIYSSLSTSDMKYPTITLSNGEEITLTWSRYINMLSKTRNHEDRSDAFDSTMISYSKNRNTFASIYNSVLQKDWAIAQARNYETTLESYLDRNNIPTEVFINLIESVREGSEAVRRYFRLKKKLLEIDDYHMFDRFLPLIEFDKTYQYDDVTEWIVESVAPLGEEYQEKMRTALEGRYIDVYENDGKYTGAFSSGSYGLHPFVLMNYNETLTSVFTLAHEMGHSLHTILACDNQPYATAGYSIFVAEVASTFNEQLLLSYLLDKTTDPKERVVLLQRAVDELVGTFYRQVVFADFEWRAHQKVERGEPITSETLYDLCLEVYDNHYGDAMVQDSLLGYYWTAVPHFYFGPYYVYKYATSYAASSHLIKSIAESNENNRPEIVASYLDLLKSGGSDYPIVLLNKAGVDMTDPGTFRAIIDLTDELVRQLEEELEKL